MATLQKIITVLLLSATLSSAADERHIYLLIGQSNMAGRAPFSEAEAGEIDRCFLLNAEDQWEPAKNPLNRYSTIRKSIKMQKMNPGYTFVQSMLGADKKATIGLVVNAKGGTSIKLWKKDSQFYKEAIRRTKAAQKSGTLKGILWHQGESDRKDSNYHKKLTALIEDLRKDLGAPDLPFVMGQINDGELINGQLQKVIEKVPATACASAKGLEMLDHAHFATTGMKELGKRYATEMQKLQSAKKTK